MIIIKNLINKIIELIDRHINRLVVDKHNFTTDEIELIETLLDVHMGISTKSLNKHLKAFSKTKRASEESYINYYSYQISMCNSISSKLENTDSK